VLRVGPDGRSSARSGSHPRASRPARPASERRAPRRRESELRRLRTRTARFTIERLERPGNAAPIERTKLRGCFRDGAVPGRNKLRFTGYLLGRVLTPGRYDLVVTVSDVAGERSRAKRTGLRILR